MDTTQLCYLFRLLKQKGFIATDELAKTICDHFIDKRDKPLKVKNINQVLNNIRDNNSGKSRNSDELEEIIEEMSKLQNP